MLTPRVLISTDSIDSCAQCFRVFFFFFCCCFCTFPLFHLIHLCNVENTGQLNDCSNGIGRFECGAKFKTVAPAMANDGEHYRFVIFIFYYQFIRFFSSLNLLYLLIIYYSIKNLLLLLSYLLV